MAAVAVAVVDSMWVGEDVAGTVIQVAGRHRAVAVVGEEWIGVVVAVVVGEACWWEAALWGLVGGVR